MPDPTKFQSKNFEGNFNGLMLLMVLIVVGANIWLVFNEIFTGVIYFTLFAGTIISFVIIQKMTAGESKNTLFAKIIKSPFTTSLRLAVSLYLIGWIAPLVFGLVLVLLKSTLGIQLNITSFSIPLLGSNILQGVTQSFSATEIQKSMPWNIFNISLNAGTSEEFIFTFGIPFIIVAVIVLIIWGINNGNMSKVKSTIGRWKIAIISVAVTIGTLIFVGLHSLNETYNTLGEFVFAGIFKLISLITVYVNGLFMSFWVGYHQSNNFIWLIGEKGFIPVLNGLFSGAGLVLPIILVVSIGYVAFNFDKIREDFKKYKFFGG